ncbi:hypothetical protein M408DRAFT_111151 [Serendipita vermifera MAFF 305830]|uniref:Uncharacterized protein n=1 Tax=Serendipita vermifera MAFF 305830 TaxID=933852 RepID=A0A0C3AMB1_SERVB|nr:hypothetical protein M408DRAFT_111151 [Serendipita vermifera MAFF 305830]
MGLHHGWLCQNLSAARSSPGRLHNFTFTASSLFAHLHKFHHLTSYLPLSIRAISRPGHVLGRYKHGICVCSMATIYNCSHHLLIPFPTRSFSLSLGSYRDHEGGEADRDECIGGFAETRA